MNLLFGLLLAALLGEAGAVGCFTGNTTYPMCHSSQCSGECNAGNGCTCIDNTQICIPETADACDPNIYVSCCPDGLYWYQNENCCKEELNCAPACLDDEMCVAVSGSAECICNQTIYRHANRSELLASVQCDSLAMTVSFSKCLLEKFHYNPSGMILGNDSSPNCTNNNYNDILNNKRITSFQAVPVAGRCQTKMSINNLTVTYSNFFYIPPDYSANIIISNALNISFSCTYNRTMQTSLGTVLHPIFGTVQLPPVNGVGSVTATMAAYKSNTFTGPIENGDTVTVGEPLYIGIWTSFVDGDAFVLRAESCSASPTNSSTDAVMLISGSCALNQAVNTQWWVSSGTSLEVRFSVDTFIFENAPDVYIFCNLRLCNKTAETCGCSSTRSSSNEPTRMASLGPVSLSDTTDTSSGSHTVVPWAVLGSSLLALLSLRLM